MNELIKFAINICILVIIASVVTTVTENMKNGKLVRSAAAVMMIVVTLNFILSIDFDSNDIFIAENYSVDRAEVWQNALLNVKEQLENEMLEAVNRLNVGPQGFGGKTTALAVNIETFPTHIAGLPCAVNIGCHVTRHKSFII